MAFKPIYDPIGVTSSDTVITIGQKRRAFQAANPGASTETVNALSHALHRAGLANAGDELRTAIIEYVADEAYEIARATAPVKSGALRDSISKRIENNGYLIRGIVAIPNTIKYRFAVIFGDKRHPTANRFMEKALERAMEKFHLNFNKIVAGALQKSRGK